MCQISVVVEREGEQETVAEGVTGLDQTSGGVVLRTFFEEPLTVAGVSIKSIDFLEGTVYLSSTGVND